MRKSVLMLFNISLIATSQQINAQESKYSIMLEGGRKFSADKLIALEKDDLIISQQSIVLSIDVNEIESITFIKESQKNKMMIIFGIAGFMTGYAISANHKPDPCEDDSFIIGDTICDIEDATSYAVQPLKNLFWGGVLGGLSVPIGYFVGEALGKDIVINLKSMNIDGRKTRILTIIQYRR